MLTSPDEALELIARVCALPGNGRFLEETREFVEAFHRPDEGFEFALASFVSGVAANARLQPKRSGGLEGRQVSA